MIKAEDPAIQAIRDQMEGESSKQWDTLYRDAEPSQPVIVDVNRAGLCIKNGAVNGNNLLVSSFIPRTPGVAWAIGRVGFVLGSNESGSGASRSTAQFNVSPPQGALIADAVTIKTLYTTIDPLTGSADQYTAGTVRRDFLFYPIVSESILWVRWDRAGTGTNYNNLMVHFFFDCVGYKFANQQQ